MLSDYRVELMHSLACVFLIVFDNTIEMVAANANATKYKLKKQFQKTENVGRMNSFSLRLTNKFFQLLNQHDEMLLIGRIDAVHQLHSITHQQVQVATELRTTFTCQN